MGEELVQVHTASRDGARCHLWVPTAEPSRANTAGEVFIYFFHKPEDLSSSGRCDSQDTNIFKTDQNKAARVTSPGMWWPLGAEGYKT